MAFLLIDSSFPDVQPLNLKHPTLSILILNRSGDKDDALDNRVFRYHRL